VLDKILKSDIIVS